MAGNCTVCFHPMRSQIDRWMRENQNFAPILREIAAAARRDDTIRVYKDKRVLQSHRLICLKLDPLKSATGSGGSDRFVPVTPSSEEETSNEELYRDARRQLRSKLPELDAKSLQALVIEGMKLEREKIAAAAKERPEGDGEDADAMAEMQRAARPHAV